jgi:hypothetical protein
VVIPVSAKVIVVGKKELVRMNLVKFVILMLVSHVEILVSVMTRHAI